MYKTVINVPVVVHKCKHLPLKLRGRKQTKGDREQLLRRMLGYNADAETAGCGKLHNDDPHNLRSSTVLLGSVDQ